MREGALIPLRQAKGRIRVKPSGKTILIYCPTGEPRGVRVAEITTGIVQAVVVPRAKLAEASKRPEFSGVGLYFLFGESEAGGLPMAYIGESEDCCDRISQHNRSKDFWSVAVAIVSRTSSFTKAHGKLLEAWAIAKAKRSGRYVLESDKGGEPTVPEWMRDDVASVFETTEVLLGALGFPIFEAAAGANTDEQDYFFCKRGGANARGVFNEEGFVVLAGSIARRDPSLSSHDTVEPRREELLGSGVIAVCKEGGVALTGQALSLHNLATNGIFVRASGSSVVARSVAASGTGINVANGDGVSGNPTVALSDALSSVGSLTPVADRISYYTGAAAAALATLSAFGRSLIDDADAAAARTTLGLGSLATQAAASVAITGGTIDNVTLDGGTF